MNRLRTFWFALEGSLWFVPVVIVCLGSTLAVGLVEIHAPLDGDIAQRWPRLFGAGAAGSRAMLTAIATSMITVAGVVFSITIVALSLAASQYSPRVLRTFMSDRPTQIVLGTFIAIFTYCLIVLRTIRGGDEGAFVPSIAVLGGIGMAFLGVGLLIYFVHHVAASIQVSSILARIADDALAAIDLVFPRAVGAPPLEDAEDDGYPVLPERWLALAAPRTGYVVGVDSDALLEFATRAEGVLRIVPEVGDFVVAGQPLLALSADSVGLGGSPAAGIGKGALAAVSLGQQRTVHQDVRYAIQLIVDVALKALSPSVHDPTTAEGCIDHLSALMVRLSGRCVVSPWRHRGGRLRLVARSPDFPTLLGLAFEAVTHHAGDHVEIYQNLVGALARVAAATRDEARRSAVHSLLEALVARAARADLPPSSRNALAEACADLSATLRSRAAGPDAAASRSP
ncbi:MAG: DUF2254 domain-containing protein [Caldimonas sp.]